MHIVNELRADLLQLVDGVVNPGEARKSTLEESAFYSEFKWMVNGPLVAQLVAVTGKDTDELEEKTAWLTLGLKKLKLSAAVAIGMLGLEGIPEHTVNEEECRQY
jgi:hypothetical protein